MTGENSADQLRIGTAEREAAIAALGEHFAQGRLDSDEYTERVDAALAARNRADIYPLFTDLPGPNAGFTRPELPQAYPAGAPTQGAGAAQQGPVSWYSAPPAAGHYPPTPLGYPQPGYQTAAYGYPYPPMVAVPAQLSPKSRVAAGLLQVFFGWIGVGRFYTGHHGIAVAQILVTLFTFGLGGLWGVIDGIILLAAGGQDAQGRWLS
jgi:TM2 domain-containing membrane protein YozV